MQLRYAFGVIKVYNRGYSQVRFPKLEKAAQHRLINQAFVLFEKRFLQSLLRRRTMN